MTNFMWMTIITMGMVWGSAAFFREIIIATVHPHMSIFLRTVFASIMLIGIFVWKHRGVYHNNAVFGVTRHNFVVLIFIGVFSAFLPFLTVTSAQVYITGGLATIIVSATAFNTIVLSAIFIPSEKLRWHRLVGVILGIVGVGIAVGLDNARGAWGGGMLAFVGAMSYAVGAVIGRLYLRNCPPLSCVLITHVVALFCTGILLLSTGADQFFLVTPSVLFFAFLLGLLPSVIGGFMYFYVLEHSGAGNTLVGTIVSAPSAMILGAVFLGERITATQLWGFAIVVLGLIILDGRVFKLH